MATRQDSPEIRRDIGRQEPAERTDMDAEVRRERERETGLQTAREAPAERTRRGLERSVAPTPFASMQRLMEDIDQIVRDFWYGVEGGRSPGMSRSWMPELSRNATELWGDRGGEFGVDLWSPSIEAFERDNTFVVRAELPGVSKDEVNVDITETVLTIEGQRRRESEDRGQNFYRSERSYGRFYRLIPLPEGIDPDKADAKFNDGVLEITMPLPKKEERKGRRLSLR